MLTFFLIYPSVHTFYLSFFGPGSRKFVGVSNYIFAFTNRVMLTAFRNNALWVLVFTTLTVFLGLILAVILDRVRYETVVKSIVFMPMAISFVGAAVIWKFVYAYRPPGAPQVGILNGFLSLFHASPVGWLIERPWINNFCLIGVGVWIWTGFCMVILSAAYKGIPGQLLEAARVDGAGEWQIFRRVILPLMMPTMAVLTTTMTIFVLKIFDIVYVMTNGNFSTEVIANRMYKEMFHFRNFGRASAIAVILLVLIVPMMLINIRRFKREELLR
ncbi:sugar ABC transporter permease [Candidatus Aerophobetes bacterium]|uniref:Sugar ABC transporter permease n=1 Tax=Aerophobetes bacterium TaxID=2030807 RepID=A0A523QK51_UNCAE|nr:MAG: sugar ABC transporter permease [Candidatus Aerophobetes bacterium]